MKVMTEAELKARNEIKWETYQKKVQIEARVLGDLSMNHIIPVATKYQSELVDNVSKILSVYPKEKAEELSAYNRTLIEKINKHTNFIVDHVEDMVETRKIINKIEDIREKAIQYHDKIVPAMEKSVTTLTNSN